ncbi:uncharacterized protein LOC129585796 isoform X2 [Paramacrobiotus metropolitanus]|uniref:uncharacterized protein LOC129585796 isoform X2 n=1 Tax=Paramacrobiotus metropolitanus TaxID=2943436 RepID=UPI002445C832|nr:uncharacterized protein LOC129585796 isoform X2 [Paramacrobiotus metropolitanus]
MNSQNDGKSNNEPLPGPASGKPGDSKMVFIAEYGYLLAGGSVCFLLGVILTLVFVWIIILICNRQIALERIGTQSKVAHAYAEYSVQNEAIKKPYINLSKSFNCTATQRHLLLTDYQYRNMETQMELSFELGMKWAQTIINKTAYAGLFTTILAAAIIMLFIEVLCVIVFMIYEQKFKGVTTAEEAEQLNEKYNFLIQGPKVIHHGVFEVTNSLSNASLHVKNLVSRASNSITDIKSKFTPRTMAATTDMTITVRPPAPTTPPVRPTASPRPDQISSGPPNWQYQFQADSARASSNAPDADARTEFSKSVGLNTLRDHLDKHNLLIPLSEHNSEILSHDLPNEPQVRHVRYSDSDRRSHDHTAGYYSGGNATQYNYDWNRASGDDLEQDAQSWNSSR